MAMAADILDRKTSHFVLWRPRATASAPKLLIGQLHPGNPPAFIPHQNPFVMTPVAGVTGLWEIAGTACGLTDGQIYHYWFEIEDTQSSAHPPPLVRCTDPLALTVDWRIFPNPKDSRQPAAVIKFANGKLVPCDPGGKNSSLRARCGSTH
jgi:pullulanase